MNAICDVMKGDWTILSLFYQSTLMWLCANVEVYSTIQKSMGVFNTLLKKCYSNTCTLMNKWS